jgi:PIN domain nuclease of toxin-antitoxin system
MRLLLDTNILLALAPRSSVTLAPRTASAVRSVENVCFASVVSVWEVAIKNRIGKLEIASPTEFANYVDSAGIELLPITREQVAVELEQQPGTRDPFDRLLLAICQLEGLRLVTLDRALSAHSLAWK